jgi:phosphatidylethanolamine/phosphatidyl-N-methylethanolamine N-methyltransferase
MPAVRETFHFLGQMAKEWRTTGAVWPSGRRLAKAMANAVGHLEPGQVIIELGPGTGVFTRELLRRHPGHQVVAVEFNPAFAERLRHFAPGATVVEGCASRLSEHLAALGIGIDQVGAVVSGLPLLVLPKDLTGAILRSVSQVLPHGRRFVQFTYSKRSWRRFVLDGFHAENSRAIWLNFPPAVVMPFTRVNRVA